MPLELESLENAVAALNEVVTRSSDTRFMETLDRVTRNAFIAGVILHFEFTYELCWKFMKRWIDLNVGTTVVDGVTRRELFRHAAEQRLITDVEQWMRYHDARNRTSHTYQSAVAEQIFTITPAFTADAMRFLEALAQRND